MLDVSLIFKLGAAGLVIVLLDQMLTSAGKKEVATMIDFMGSIIIIAVIAYKLSGLFNIIKTLFQF